MTLVLVLVFKKPIIFILVFFGKNDTVSDIGLFSRISVVAVTYIQCACSSAFTQFSSILVYVTCLPLLFLVEKLYCEFYVFTVL